jgi:hypothetical protein
MEPPDLVELVLAMVSDYLAAGRVWNRPGDAGPGQELVKTRPKHTTWVQTWDLTFPPVGFARFG